LLAIFAKGFGVTSTLNECRKMLLRQFPRNITAKDPRIAHIVSATTTSDCFRIVLAFLLHCLTSAYMLRAEGPYRVAPPSSFWPLHIRGRISRPLGFRCACGRHWWWTWGWLEDRKQANAVTYAGGCHYEIGFYFYTLRGYVTFRTESTTGACGSSV